MAALELVLTLALLAPALADSASPAPPAPAAPAAGAELYPALTEAIERGAFAEARRLSASIPADSTFGRKASLLTRLADAFESRGPVSVDAGAAGAVETRSGTLRISLAPDGAFAAAVCPEQGAGGYRSILFGHPAPFTSRVTLMVDGAARSLALGRAYPIPGGGVVDLRDGDLAIQVALTGGAAPPSHPRPDATAGLRVGVSVRNDGGVAHTVGVRLLLDVTNGFDDAPQIALSAGASRSVLATTTVFEGDAVPPSIEVGGRSLVLRGLGQPAPERVIVTPLEPALASGLAIVLILVLLGLAAPVALVFALAFSPIAWALACAGAWVGRPAR